MEVESVPEEGERVESILPDVEVEMETSSSQIQVDFKVVREVKVRDDLQEYFEVINGTGCNLKCKLFGRDNCGFDGKRNSLKFNSRNGWFRFERHLSRIHKILVGGFLRRQTLAEEVEEKISKSGGKLQKTSTSSFNYPQPRRRLKEVNWESLKPKEKSCFICKTPCPSNSSSEDDSLFASIFFGNDFGQIFPEGNDQLSEQLFVIYFLRDIIDFPLALCEKFLKQCKGMLFPDTWIKFCFTCKGSVMEAIDNRRKIVEFERRFQKIKEGINSQVKMNCGDGYGGEEVGGGGGDVRDIEEQIRKYIRFSANLQSKLNSGPRKRSYAKPNAAQRSELEEEEDIDRNEDDSFNINDLLDINHDPTDVKVDLVEGTLTGRGRRKPKPGFYAKLENFGIDDIGKPKRGRPPVVKRRNLDGGMDVEIDVGPPNLKNEPSSPLPPPEFEDDYHDDSIGDDDDDDDAEFKVNEEAPGSDSEPEPDHEERGDVDFIAGEVTRSECLSFMEGDERIRKDLRQFYEVIDNPNPGEWTMKCRLSGRNGCKFDGKKKDMTFRSKYGWYCFERHLFRKHNIKVGGFLRKTVSGSFKEKTVRVKKRDNDQVKRKRLAKSERVKRVGKRDPASEKGDFICELCPTRYTNVRSFHEHVNIHTISKSRGNEHDCPQCGFPCLSSKAQASHIGLRHRDSQDLACSLCTFVGSSKRELAKHQLEHKQASQKEIIDGKFLCKFCNRLFISYALLCRHKRVKHYQEMGVAPVRCPVCDQIFSCNQHMRSHVKQVHEKDAKYFCETCGRGFLFISKLKRHSLSHATIKMHVCDICGADFGYVETLRNHMRKEHSDDANSKKGSGATNTKTELSMEYPCKYCGQAFSTKSALVRHTRRGHDNLFEHKCNECGKIYATQQSLRRHQEINHTSEGKACTYCGKMFPHQEYVRMHYKYCKYHPNRKDSELLAGEEISESSILEEIMSRKDDPPKVKIDNANVPSTSSTSVIKKDTASESGDNLPSELVIPVGSSHVTVIFANPSTT